MPRNGSGDFNLAAGNPVVPGTTIETTWANGTMSDVASALSTSISNDGQTPVVNNLQMNGWHHTGTSDPTLRNQYLTLGMSQDGKDSRIQISGGVNNLVGTLVGGATAYVAGMSVGFFAPANSTSTVTMDFNGIGPKSVFNNLGSPLEPGDLVAGRFYLMIYTGTAFELVNPVASQQAALYVQSSTSGWLRPGGGTYPALTLPTSTTVGIPAGTGVIVPPGLDGASNAIAVSWDVQTISLAYLSTSYTTTIAVNNLGEVVQFSGRNSPATLRSYVILGVAVHVGGVATQVLTTPSIFGDDGYLTKGMGYLLTNVLISGGRVTPNSASPLSVDVAAGSYGYMGGMPNSAEQPNAATLAGGTPVNFFTLAGQNVVSGVLTNIAPVASYDPNGSGVITALPSNSDATIHRLYYVQGTYVWVYGQQVYSSVADALTRLLVDRTKYNPSIRINNSVLLAEIIATKTCADLGAVTAAIVGSGGPNFSIGTAGGIADAPSDGTPYGREDGDWTPVVSAAVPEVTGNVVITKSSPKVVQVNDPVAAGYSGLNVKQLGFDWCNIEVTNPDEKTYFRSYDPVDGSLRNSTVWNLTNGNWSFPGTITKTSMPKASDFNADINGEYTMLGVVVATLPSTTGLTAGYKVRFVKQIAEVTTVNVDGGNGEEIITTIGNTDSIIFDINAEIIFVFNGTDWEV